MGRGARPGFANFFSSLPAIEGAGRSRAGMPRKDPRVTTRLGGVVKAGSAISTSHDGTNFDGGLNRWLEAQN